MNKKQHIFICIGIALITFMAIMLDSTLCWLLATLALIGESVYVCKSKDLSIWDRKFVLLILFIIIFVIFFIYSSEARNEIERFFDIDQGTVTTWKDY